MAVRQYIGARYVTKVYENSLDPSSAEWEAGVTYEPLTMVTYNNSSYLSKKEVPGSVGDPANNPIYWVVTGAYNGQIAHLQDEIDKLSGFVTPEMFGAAGDGATDDTQAVSDAIDNGKAVLCSGSYRITSQIDKSDVKLFGSGKFVLDMTGDFVLLLRDDSIIDGLTFEGTGSKVVDGLQITKRPHVTNCIFTNFNIAVTISDAYTGNITKCSFKGNTTCAKFKNMDWGSNTACTSFEILSSQFVTSDTGITSENGELVRNLVIKECVFEYDYVAGIDLYDTIGVIDSCWFEHINNAGSVAVKGYNCYFTTIMNRFIRNTVTTNYDLSQPSWSNTERGYTSIDQKSIDTRILKLTDKYTQSDTGDRIFINGDDGDINVSLGANPLGCLPYTPSKKLKLSCVSYNTYQSTPIFRARDTGFTAQKLSTGKYYIKFNRTIDDCTMFVTAEAHDNTPTDLNNIGVSSVVTAHAYGVNTGSAANFKQWKQADGVVIMVTNGSGNLVDAHVDLMVVETIT